MAFTQQQLQQAIARQTQAARDPSPVVRLLAGPGTGKSRSIAARVDCLVRQGVSSSSIFVISFLRATVNDLRSRIIDYCTAAGTGPQSNVVRVSTMHSLALSALRRANLLAMFVTGPVILDDWEQQNIFDVEFAHRFNATPGRAKAIRLAYDAYWQTRQDAHLAQVSLVERTNFLAFHSQTTTFYSCILPGEVVRRCVDAIDQGSLDPTALLGIEHLVVDEFQDLNACDQQFIRAIAQRGAILWVAGDDDQSIYAFRHADPSGIQNFAVSYPGSASHTLVDCFRCTPQVLARAMGLISYNPSPPRVLKGLTSMYAASNPPVQGHFFIWRLPSGALEARAISESCRALINAGLHGQDILILLSNRPAQLSVLEQALDDAGVSFAAPKGPELGESPMGRLILALLRIVDNKDDYAAHRDLLGLQDGVGTETCLDIESAAISSNLNFRDLFYVQFPTNAFSSRSLKAVARVAHVCQFIQRWNITDDLASHDQALIQTIEHVFNPVRMRCQEALQDWSALRTTLADGMTLEELLAYFRADSEVAQLIILQEVQQRLGLPQSSAPQIADRVRILTMHGAKGLEGKVVFVPGLEQELMPGRRALASAGLLQERRRLLYVSIARAKACCILTLVRTRSGSQAKTLVGSWQFDPRPSQFLTELGATPQNRTTGLDAAETAAIVQECADL
ncbi:MAG: ATP-dependent helicase [Bacillota bacterium]|nr:ATP-dependent helicase [Bacillota bacterium]